MMYASLSTYMHDKKNTVTLYNRPSVKSPSLSRKTQSKLGSDASPRSVSLGSMHPHSDNIDVADIHAAVLAAGPRKRLQSLEEEIRQIDEKQQEQEVSVLSVETGNDSMLVKLLNYLKDQKVGIVKIRKENLFEGEESRKSSLQSNEEDISGDAEQRTTEPHESCEAFAPTPEPKQDSRTESANKPAIKIQKADSSEKPALRRQLSRYDVFVHLQEDGMRLNELLKQIEHQVGGVRHRRKLKKQQKLLGFADRVEISPGFPMRISELDDSSKNVLMYGAELDADHPGFKDPEYRKRRMMFGQLALSYHHGQQLPRVEYSDAERQTWATVFRELMRLYPDYACNEFLVNMHLLQQDCSYSESTVPQLDDVSKFLKSKSGFQLKPVAGYLSPRDFLAGLAFRVFHTTQYIRHPSEPFYSPEPDCCHELLGHVPMLADPEFAQFSQEIGLASLGASEEDIKKLAILYFFTIEFGLCRESPPPVTKTTSENQVETPLSDDPPELRAYGAGLLSCVAELKHVLSPEGLKCVRKFEPMQAVSTECMITTFQESYFYNNSFREAVDDVRRFAEAIKKPFTVRYNPYTESLELIDNVQRVERLISELRHDATILSSALRRLGYDGNLRHIINNDTFEDLT